MPKFIKTIVIDMKMETIAIATKVSQFLHPNHLLLTR